MDKQMKRSFHKLFPYSLKTATPFLEENLQFTKQISRVNVANITLNPPDSSSIFFTENNEILRRGVFFSVIHKNTVGRMKIHIFKLILVRKRWSAISLPSLRTELKCRCNHGPCPLLANSFQLKQIKRI